MIEHTTWEARQTLEPGMMYTQAVVEHRFMCEAKAGTVLVKETFPDGTINEYKDGDKRCSTCAFVVAYSGAPHTGHGTGSVEYEITYTPRSSHEFVDVYMEFEAGEPPTRPSITIAMDGKMVYHAADWQDHVLNKSTWGLLSAIKTWMNL